MARSLRSQRLRFPLRPIFASSGPGLSRFLLPSFPGFQRAESSGPVIIANASKNGAHTLVVSLAQRKMFETFQVSTELGARSERLRASCARFPYRGFPAEDSEEQIWFMRQLPGGKNVASSCQKLCAGDIQGSRWKPSVLDSNYC